MALPMLIGILSAVGFNLVDTYFVGQLGANELAAMGFSFPVAMIAGGISMGLGNGASALISRAIGAGDMHRVQRLTSDSIVLASVIVGIFILIGLLTIDPLFTAMGAKPDVLIHIRRYMHIWYPGMFFLVIPMVGNNAIRATGDTKTPGLVMLISIGLNVVLDPLFIFGIGPFPRWEIAGAAFASLMARSLAFVIAIWILIKRENMITFTHPNLSEVLQSWKQILYIGIPHAATNIIRPVGAGAVTKIVAAYGAHAVAAFGVAMRIDALALVVVMALSSVFGPFIGQNLGARKFDRIMQGLKFSHRFAMGWGIFALMVLIAASTPIASIFSDDRNVIETIVLYLYLVPIGYGFFGIYALSNAAFNVLNKPLNALSLTVIQMIVLYIPLAYAGSLWIGLPGIFGALALANASTGTLAYFWIRKTARQQFAMLAAQGNSN
jgi:putative MATE family efflux protein